MIYTSIEFYIFALIILTLYYVFPLQLRWIILLVGSITFYINTYKTGWWILLASVTLTYVAGIIIEYIRKKYVIGRKFEKTVLAVAIILTVFPWFCIKNGNFILGSILHKSSIAWIVPLGISFYTLQSVSYLVDVYQEKIEAQKNIAKYALFILFFPQIAQGPIPRYGQLATQLYQGHTFDEEKFVKGFQLILWGFFLKFIIADKAAVIVNEIFDHSIKYTGCYVLVAGILYSIELYTDFLACITISQGVAGVFGITLENNFRRPYFAVSIKEFWRRWHITLSSWLRDYIYIPLGGSKNGRFATYVNLIITFCISGIWHGAGYKFLFWGLLHAVYQIAGNMTLGIQNKIYCYIKLSDQPALKKVVQRIGVFFWVTLAWIIFRAESLTVGLQMIKSLFMVHNPWILFNDSLFLLGLEWKEWCVLIGAILFLLFVEHKQENGVHIRQFILNKPFYLRWILYILTILCVMILGTYGFGFDAQDFIYSGF